MADTCPWYGIGPCYTAYYFGSLRLFGPIADWAPWWAMVEAGSDEVDDLDEECYYWSESEGEPEGTACEQRAPGPGYEGAKGETEVLECYEVWYEWYDEEGNVVWEEYAGFDLCFRNGLMT